jgi:hypothetical protein
MHDGRASPEDVTMTGRAGSEAAPGVLDLLYFSEPRGKGLRPAPVPICWRTGPVNDSWGCLRLAMLLAS